jgi:predicted O-methyltransferase YrrM
MDADLVETPNNFKIIPGSPDPLLWPSARADRDSAWHGHVSFAHWLVSALQPKVVVELGTHNGISFAALCHAAEKCNLDTKCFAVDTWQGDLHTKEYGAEVYVDLAAYTIRRFPDSATLLRCYFADALSLFDDQSVDILHIDGLHTYEAVSEDFETWLPKVSRRGVVLFHDTEVRDADFGVWRFWSEVTQRYPHFNFLHSYGLGVLAVGDQIAPAVAELCSMGPDAAAAVRPVFETSSIHAQLNGLALRWDEAAGTLKGIPNGRTNLALNRPYSLSSVLEVPQPAQYSPVNGVKSGGYGFHTALEHRPWLVIDLGSEQPIDEVVIYNRLDGPCAPRAKSLILELASQDDVWTTVYVHDGSVFGGIDGNPLRIRLNGTPGRFVRMSLRETQFLHLDEVEVYGLP